MKIKYMALAIGAIMSSNVIAAKNNTSADIDQRLAQLEQRLINAEQRAADAEAQILTLKQQQTTAAKTAPAVKVDAADPVAPGATPTKLTLSGYGDLKFYGDVEFNMDGASGSGSLTSVKTSSKKTGRRVLKNVGILTAVFCWASMVCAKWITAILPVSPPSRWLI